MELSSWAPIFPESVTLKGGTIASLFFTLSRHVFRSF